jgi:hypothetical protein
VTRIGQPRGMAQSKTSLYCFRFGLAIMGIRHSYAANAVCELHGIGFAKG